MDDRIGAGNYLRSLRLRRAWTHDRLALEAGVSRTSIYRAENGLGVRLSTIALLASALGVDASELAGLYHGGHRAKKKANL